MPAYLDELLWFTIGLMSNSKTASLHKKHHPSRLRAIAHSGVKPRPLGDEPSPSRFSSSHNAARSVLVTP